MVERYEKFNQGDNEKDDVVQDNKHFSELINVTLQQYKRTLDNYYQTCHEHHIAEQKLLKIKRYLMNILQDNDLEQLTINNILSATLINSSPKIIIDNENAVPTKYRRLQRLIDTAKIRQDLAKGIMVPGVHVETKSLEIALQGR